MGDKLACVLLALILLVILEQASVRTLEARQDTKASSHTSAKEDGKCTQPGLLLTIGIVTPMVICNQDIQTTLEHDVRGCAAAMAAQVVTIRRATIMRLVMTQALAATLGVAIARMDI